MRRLADPRRFLVRFAAVVVSSCALSGVAGASDGVVELSQACATAGSCTPTDAPGFPITIAARGSYRFTSDLAVPDPNTHGIEISSDDVTLDFNGFTLFGPGTVPIGTLVCSAPGTGSGVVATGAAAGFVAQNGRVRGMGSHGIDVFAANARIDRMIVERNCGNAIRIGVAGLVIDTQVRANRGTGILTASGSRIRDSIADNNYETGIQAGAASVVTDCIATSNGNSGIDLDLAGSGGVVLGNAVVSNGWRTGFGGMDVPPGALASQNSVSANTGTGINISPLAGAALNATSANTGSEIGGGIRLTCNAEDGVATCPP